MAAEVTGLSRWNRIGERVSLAHLAVTGEDGDGNVGRGNANGSDNGGGIDTGRALPLTGGVLSS